MNNETSYFFIPDYQFQKVFFYVSLGSNFYCVCGAPPQLWRPWATAQFALP